MKKLTALLVVLIGLLQYRLWFGDGNVLEFQRLNDRIAELQQEGARRRERNAALEAEVMDLKHGLDAVEERARQDLGMIKQGEVFVLVIDDHHPESNASPADQPEKPLPVAEKPEAARQAKVEKAPQDKNREEKSRTQAAKPASSAKVSERASAKGTRRTETAKPPARAKRLDQRESPSPPAPEELPTEPTDRTDQ